MGLNGKVIKIEEINKRVFVSIFIDGIRYGANGCVTSINTPTKSYDYDDTKSLGIALEKLSNELLSLKE